MIPILSQVEQNEPKQVPVAVSVKEKNGGNKNEQTS